MAKRKTTVAETSAIDRLETSFSANSIFFLSALGLSDVGYYREMTENIQDVADQYGTKFLYANASTKRSPRRNGLGL
jgi:hypothetical protein